MADPTNRRCYITIEVASGTRDAVTNEARRTWSTLKSFWASMEPNRANQVTTKDGEESSTMWTVRADYYDGVGVTTAHRILYESRYFDILGTMPDDSYHKDWMCKARETDLTASG